MVFIKADCRMRPLSDFYSTLIGSRNERGQVRQEAAATFEAATGEAGREQEQEQAVRRLLPTWQKACGLITHGSQGAKTEETQAKS